MIKRILGALPPGLRPSPEVFRARRNWGLLVLFLASCARPYVEPIDVPANVADFIPRDVDPGEVNRDPEGCYFYVYASELILIRDFDGQPVCEISQ